MSNSACLNGGAILFFTIFARVRLPMGVSAFLESFDTADVDADRRIELKSLTASGSFGGAEEHTNLLAKLVDEDCGRAGCVEATRNLA